MTATDELLDLLEKEGLEFKLKQYYLDLMKIYLRLGDLESALQYAEAALHKAEEYGARDDDDSVVAIQSNIGKLSAALAAKAEREGLKGWGR